METRQIIAYALIVLLIAAVAFALASYRSGQRRKNGWKFRPRR